jgi:hypothetical protein
MPSIFYIDPMNDRQIELDLAALVTLIKGSSVTSMAHSDNFFELGLSDAFNLRIQAENGEADILLFSTLNKDEIPPVRLQLISDDQIPTAETLEKRIHSLRQLYATAFLIDAGRSDEIARALAENPNIDLETLLEENDRLLVRSASTGSFWITLLTKTKAAFSTLSLIGPLFYDQGRQALLSRMRATTELKWLEVAQKSNDITLQGADRLIELIQKIEKIKNPTLREQMHELLMGKMQEIGRSDLSRLGLPTPPSTFQAKAEGEAAPPAPTGTAIISTTFALPKPSDQGET